MIQVLRELSDVEGVVGALIVDPDGITIAQELDADADLVAAACVQIVNSIRDALAKLEEDELVQALIEPVEGKIFLREISDVGTLVALSERNVNVGLIRLAMGSAAEKIRAIRAAL
jgi:predicted regulator of Ras-like GTPase activity (Roadblock/LC7/MglB family)